MQIRKFFEDNKPKRIELLIDTEEDARENLRGWFNDAVVQGFETELKAGFTQLPVFGDIRCYGRLSGAKNADGTWLLCEEFYYGMGPDAPKKAKPDLIGEITDNVSGEEAARRVRAFKPPSPDDLW